MNNIENTKFLLKINQTPDVHTFDIEESATSENGDESDDDDEDNCSSKSYW